MNIISFFVGMFIGTAVGISIMALLIAGRDD